MVRCACIGEIDHWQLLGGDESAGGAYDLTDVDGFRQCLGTLTQVVALHKTDQLFQGDELLPLTAS